MRRGRERPLPLSLPDKTNRKSESDERTDDLPAKRHLENVLFLLDRCGVMSGSGLEKEKRGWAKMGGFDMEKKMR